MELCFVFPHLPPSKCLDSIIIRSNGISQKLNINIQDTVTFYLITSDSLTTPLTLNPGDLKINIDTYMKPGHGNSIYHDVIACRVLSNFPGCSLCKTKTSLLEDIFYISQTPSLGRPNVCLREKMTGHIYDMNGKPVTSYSKDTWGDQYYFVLYEPLVIYPDGTYSTVIYPVAPLPLSEKYFKLLVRQTNWGTNRGVQDIDTLEFSYIHPDTVIVRDIYLRNNKYIVTSVKNKELPKDAELTLINYPNPFNSSTNFFVRFPNDIKEKSGNINIFNSAGSLVKTISVKDGTTSFWDSKDMDGDVMATGVYYYQLNVNNNVLKSGSMILLK